MKKSKKITRKIRFLAFILTLCLILGALPLCVFADETEGIPEELQDRIVEEIPFEPEYLPGDLTFAECRTATLNMAEVPAVISQAQIEQYQHVNRLYEQEPDLYTVIFQNRDGSKTVYVFAQPVKSVSGNGAVTDMSAAAIVSAHQPALPSQNAMMQSSLSQNVAPILAMQERLDAYKAANDLKDYQMLDDILEATTVSASSVLVLNNSVSVASVSTTYSSLAGEYAIKLPNDTGYLTCVNDIITTRQYVAVPHAKWLFGYYGDSQYTIQSLSKQGYYLSYVDGDTCSLFYEPDMETDAFEVLWTVTALNTGYTIECNGASLSDNASMNYVSDGHICVLTNHTTFVPLTSVSIGQTVITASVDEYVYVPTIYTNPENASYAISDSDFTWYTTNDSMLTPDMDSFFALETGIAQIYCKHLYTGIESNRVTVIISDNISFMENGIYVLREYLSNPDASAGALTMRISSGSTVLSVESITTDTYNYNGQARGACWYNMSQGFVFTPISDGLFTISAIMTTSQYSAPGSLGSGFNSYYLVDKNTVCNTLAVNESRQVCLTTGSSITDANMWYICKDGNQYYIMSKVHQGYYLSFVENSDNDDNESNNGCTVVLSSSPSAVNSQWLISFMGVDTPCIKQNENNYCGAASILQAIYGCRGEPIVSTETGLLKDQVNVIAEKLGLSAGGSGAAFNKFVDKINGVHLLNENIYKYGAKSTLENFKTSIAGSLEKGYPAIVYVIGRLLNHYPNDTTYGGHYICVIGYDSITEQFLISDCTYVAGYFGLHLVDAEDLYGALKTGYLNGSAINFMYA